jgi:hypothetical protein
MKPVIFTIVAHWDADARLWVGRCDDVPVIAEAATLDDLLARATEQTLDLLPDNHPDVDPARVMVQLIVQREAASAVA